MRRRICILTIAAAAAAWAGDWTEPVEVKMGIDTCVSYRARLDGEYLILQATHEGDWHTYAMDNEVRAKEKLAGKMSLGIDAPTQISVSGGLELAGGWLQTPPLDLSKPELRWFTWGYDDPAVFAAKVRRSGSGPAVIQVRGQACTADKCKNIELELTLAPPDKLDAEKPKSVDLATLVAVRQ